MEQIVIEERKLKAMLDAIAGFLILAASIAFFVFGLKEKIIVCWLLGFLAIVVSGIYFLVLLTQTLERKSLLTITFDGIYDNSTKNPVGYIAFQDIERFCIVSLYGKKVIGVIPKDENSFIEKLSSIRQVTAKTNVTMKCPPLSIRVDRAKDMSLEDIFTLLKKRLDDYSSLYD